MIAKLGFILLVLLFGALMFLAGILAPADWRHSMERWVAPAAARIESNLPASASKPASGNHAAASLPANQPAAASASTPATTQ